MDKQSRAKIIAVKLEEVLDEVDAEEQTALQDQLQQLLNKNNIEESIEELNELSEAIEVKKEELSRLLRTFDKQMPKANIQLDTIYTRGNASTYYVRSGFHTRDFKEVIVSSDVMTHLTRHRNSTHKRVGKVVHEAMALLLEDDAERMQKFLEL